MPDHKNPIDLDDLATFAIRTHEQAQKRRRAKSLVPPARRSGGLFPSEAEIARRLSQHPSTWKAKSSVLEREGFPRIDPLMGGRYWPAVFAWWNRQYGLTNLNISQPDGEEDLNVLR